MDQVLHLQKAPVDVILHLSLMLTITPALAQIQNHTFPVGFAMYALALPMELEKLLQTKRTVNVILHTFLRIIDAVVHQDFSSPRADNAQNVKLQIVNAQMD